MCGIVGYTGRKDAVKVVLDGLSRLEYRGYDSAGISLKKNGHLEVYKREGKLQNLKSYIKEEKIKGKLAIGHTRWATHGVVNQDNAHPHGNDEFSIVHNGIIENAAELKTILKKEGFKFQSDTDSEVFLVLLTKHYQENPDIKDAISRSFDMVDGNSAFVIITNESHDIYAIRRSAPLVCGHDLDQQNLFVSSDPYALVGYADKLYFPEDEVLCRVNSKAQLIEFFELNGKESKRFLLQDQNMSLDISSKGKFAHFMLKEIHEQPELIKRLTQYYFQDDGLKRTKDLKESKIDHIYINACGTAWHAGLVIKNYFEDLTPIKVNVELASEFRYRNHYFTKKDLGLFISQSGETADTLACQELCSENKVKTFSIVNVEGSSLYRQCNENFPILAGAEIGVASTKAFTLQCLTGLFIAKGLEGKPSDKKIQKECELLSERIQELLENTRKIQAIAKKIHNARGFLFTGRGIYYPIALEGALKLKEIAYVHAEGYAAGELKHGPIALIDQNMVNIAIIGPELYEKTLSNAEEVRAREGVMVVVGPQNDPNLKEISDHYIGLDFEGLDNLSPLYVNVVMQLLSYYIAKLKGTDIDKPRNLAKSVTVE